MDLIIPLWKPINITSFKALKSVKDTIKGAKVGHAGTLDPFAEGLLIACTGKKTKQVESIMSMDKEYICNIKLGVQTDTHDNTGKIIGIKKVPKLTDGKVKKVISNFIGEIKQRPPKFSALKIFGVRSYQMARNGLEFSLLPRKITIYSIDLLDYDDKSIKIKVNCGKGTYIRSLCRDIALALNTAGYIDSLVRTKVGIYDKSKAIHINEVQNWIHSKI